MLSTFPRAQDNIFIRLPVCLSNGPKPKCTLYTKYDIQCKKEKSYTFAHLKAEQDKLCNICSIN